MHAGMLGSAVFLVGLRFLGCTQKAVVRSSSDGVAIRYVLTVLCMTSRFHTVGSTQSTVRHGESATAEAIDYNRI